MFNNFLEIQNTTFVASKLNKVLDFNLTIKNEGDIICLLGPSGIGKTTILRSIAGLQKIPKGLILLKGKTLSSNIEHIEPEKRNVALSFQDNSLFPHYTILDNINFGAKRNRNAKYNFVAKELIELLHLQGLENKFPHQVSAGEAQRVSLARSLKSSHILRNSFSLTPILDKILSRDFPIYDFGYLPSSFSANLRPSSRLILHLLIM